MNPSSKEEASEAFFNLMKNLRDRKKKRKEEELIIVFKGRHLWCVLLIPTYHVRTLMGSLRFFGVTIVMGSLLFPHLASALAVRGTSTWPLVTGNARSS
jgi:hypothetical protein